MKSFKVSEIVDRVCYNIKIALCAALFAFAMYFIAFIMPTLPAVSAQNQIIRLKEIASEMHHFVKSLG